MLSSNQLAGGDPASCDKTNSRYYPSAGWAAHLEAVRRRSHGAEALIVFAIEDELHAERLLGQLSTFSQAIAELRRKAALPWDEPAQPGSLYQLEDLRSAVRNRGV